MEADNELLKKLKDKEKLSILIIGVLCLLFVPVFKTVTHLPPFMGILMGVGILWFYTEMLYARKPIDEDLKLRLSKVVHRIDGGDLVILPRNPFGGGCLALQRRIVGFRFLAGRYGRQCVCGEPDYRRLIVYRG